MGRIIRNNGVGVFIEMERLRRLFRGVEIKSLGVGGGRRRNRVMELALELRGKGCGE